MRAAVRVGIALAVSGAAGVGRYELDHFNKPTPNFANPHKVAGCVGELGSHAITASKIPKDCIEFSADFGYHDIASSTYQPDPDALIEDNGYSSTGSNTTSDVVTYTLLSANSFQQSATRQAATWEKRWDNDNNFVNGNGLKDGLALAGLYGAFVMAWAGRGLMRTDGTKKRHAGPTGPSFWG